VLGERRSIARPMPRGDRRVDHVHAADPVRGPRWRTPLLDGLVNRAFRRGGGRPAVVPHPSPFRESEVVAAD
jgi:hypothetical protein